MSLLNLQADLSILTSDQVVKSEQLTIDSGVPVENLMERAGTAVYHYISANYLRQPAIVVCGPGNNGGDGYVVARLLLKHGWPVKVVGATQSNPPYSVQKWTGETCAFSPDSIDENTLIVDGIFGTGLERPLTGVYAEVVEAMNQRANHIIAIDLPSGIHTNTAEVMGVAVDAEATVSFNFRKPAHVLLPGREYCGFLILQDIGLEALPKSESLVYVNDPVLWRSLYPFPQAATHKYQRGFVQILGGSEMTGAARFAAASARRMGAGMVMIASREESHDIYEMECAGVLTRILKKPVEFAEDDRITVALIGPGGGRTTFLKETVLAWLKTGKACVLDADALYVFKDNPDELFKAIKGPTVLTPHEGEFSRLFDLKGSKIERVQKAAEVSGATVLLKGADTVIANPEGLTLAQDHSSGFLATGGTGDVLAGMIAALLGQGLDGLSAAGFAAWVHSAIAQGIGIGLLAEDMPDNIPTILKEILTRD